jgi:hypothetical protein
MNTKAYLRTVKDRLGYLRDRHSSFALWGYNKVLIEYLKEFEGGVSEEALTRTDSVESICRIFRLKYKAPERELESKYRMAIKTV